MTKPGGSKVQSEAPVCIGSRVPNKLKYHIKEMEWACFKELN
jgi:hypothetical protein